MTPSAKDANVKIAVASINHRLARGGRTGRDPNDAGAGQAGALGACAKRVCGRWLFHEMLCPAADGSRLAPEFKGRWLNRSKVWGGSLPVMRSVRFVVIAGYPQFLQTSGPWPYVLALCVIEF